MSAAGACARGMLHAAACAVPALRHNDSSFADLSMTRNPNDRAQQVLAAIFESAVDAIVVIDAQGRVEAFNPAAERLFGYSEPELLGRNVNTLMPSPYREEHDGYLARYLTTGEAKIIG